MINKKHDVKNPFLPLTHQFRQKIEYGDFHKVSIGKYKVSNNPLV